MLRNPIDWIISHYYYVRRIPRHYLYNRVVSQNMNLEEYVMSGILSEINNEQDLFISWYKRGGNYFWM